MLKIPQSTDWREARRNSARRAILDGAWDAVNEEGLAGLSLRGLARRVGITAPTIYAYFDSKNAIYDAMFAEAATTFAERMAEPYDSKDAREVLTEGVNRFVAFCIGNAARYQLLFQRTLPGFEPSAESYVPAVVALEGTRGRLARCGVTAARHLDLFTALLTGLVDQQISNDPGGDRWLLLIDESIDMFLAHCQPTLPPTENHQRTTLTRGEQS